MYDVLLNTVIPCLHIVISIFGPPLHLPHLVGGGGGGWGGGDGGETDWGVGVVDGGSVNAFLADVLTRVMRVTVCPSLFLFCSVLQSDVVGGSVVGVVGPL